jgi:hypothetical protein
MAGERGSGINTGTCVDLVLIPVPPVPLEFFCMKFQVASETKKFRHQVGYGMVGKSVVNVFGTHF